MIDVNKILGVSESVVEPKIEESVSEPLESYSEQLLSFMKSLSGYVSVIDLAIQRKIPYESFVIESKTGLHMVYDSSEFTRRIQKFGLKQKVRTLDKKIESFSFDKMVSELENNYLDYSENKFRLIKHNDQTFLGTQSENNTLFFSKTGDVSSFLLFNSLEDFYFSWEKEQLNEEEIKEVNVDTTDVSEVLEENKPLKTEEKVDFTRELQGIDDLINKYKK